MSDSLTPILTGISTITDTDELSAIISAARDRQQSLAKITVAGIKKGDEVKFSDEIRPKYLVGLPVTVVKKNRESIVVDCPDKPEYGRFQNAKGVRCPNSLIASA